ncbi:MAG: CDP-glucose 4,6-dehydratase [Bacteroidales bacterium]
MIYTNFYKGKKVLVTGSTGFKGSWLCIWLKMMGAEVYGYALKPKSEQDNFVVCGLEQQIHQYYGDIRDFQALQACFLEVHPDVAFHLAAQALVLDSYVDPHYTFETNLMGTLNFLEAVRKTSSVQAAVNITSDKCYQNKEQIYGYREIDPMGGKDPYSASKGCAELMAQSYIHSFFISPKEASLACARAGNVIGGGDWAKDRIIPDFFRAYIDGKKLEIRNPKAVRPWQHVLEPLNAYLLLGFKLYTDGKEYSGGWNFGPMPNEEHTVGELVDQMIFLFGKGSYVSPKHSTELLHEAHLLKLDITKALTVLHWHPVLNFKQTVDFTLQGYLEDMNPKNIYAQRIEQIQQFMAYAGNEYEEA